MERERAFLKSQRKRAGGKGGRVVKPICTFPLSKKIAKQTYAEAGKWGTYKTITEEQGGRGSKIEVLSERIF